MRIGANPLISQIKLAISATFTLRPCGYTIVPGQRVWQQQREIVMVHFTSASTVSKPKGTSSAEISRAWVRCMSRCSAI